MGLGVFCVLTYSQKGCVTAEWVQGLGVVFWAKWDPIWTKWDPSGQFVRKVGKSALELEKKINHSEFVFISNLNACAMDVKITRDWTFKANAWQNIQSHTNQSWFSWLFILKLLSFYNFLLKILESDLLSFWHFSGHASTLKNVSKYEQVLVPNVNKYVFPVTSRWSRCKRKKIKIRPHSNGHQFKELWTTVDKDFSKSEKYTLIAGLSTNFCFGSNDAQLARKLV